MNTDMKKKALNIIRDRNLCSYMNNTKWNELRMAMLNEMPFPPAYIIKYLFEDECPQEKNFQSDVWYFGDWNEGLTFEDYFNGGFAIEWIKIRPRYLKHRGVLIDPEIIDATEKFEEILIQYNIPFEEENGVYCIYGYR